MDVSRKLVFSWGSCIMILGGIFANIQSSFPKHVLPVIDGRCLKPLLILKGESKMGFLRNIFKNRLVGADTSLRTGHPASRSGDGTALGDAILQGTYLPQAGSEPLGYFDPAIAPFRMLSDGRIGLLYDPKWDQMLETIQIEQAKLRASGGTVYDQPFEDDLLSKFTALVIAVKLELPSIQGIVTAFQPLVENESIATFLAGTTMNYFFFKYTEGVIWFSEVVANEIMLNSLANLLLKDPEFTKVHSLSEFKAKAISLLESRKHEMRNPW